MQQRGNTPREALFPLQFPYRSCHRIPEVGYCQRCDPHRPRAKSSYKEAVCFLHALQNTRLKAAQKDDREQYGKSKR